MLYFSKLCNAICVGVLTHPVTGERYGGGDWENAAKLAEIEAVPVSDVDVNKTADAVLDSVTLAVSQDGTSATRTRTWRPKNATELKADARAQLVASDALSARKVEDLWSLLLAKGLVKAEDVPAAVKTWIDSRVALRSQAV